MLGLGYLPLLLPLVSAGALAPRATACNNSPALCSKSYGEITHLGAHDSPFVKDASTGYTTSGNQYFNSTVQLNAGVRLLSAQVHNSNDQWRLCHSSCALLDVGLFSDWLKEIKTWMDANPNDVVTLVIVNSDDATASELNSQFDTAGITDYAYTPTSQSTAPTSWPTLQTLINAKTRLMVFVASLSPSSNTVAPYLMDEFTFLFENPYDVTSASNFTCAPDRPTGLGSSSAAVASNRLPFMNHMLYTNDGLGIQSPNYENVSKTNAASGSTGNLGTSASTCQSEYGRQPAFILVDFFDQGPAIDTVDKLNNVTNAVGRTAVPNTNSEAQTSDGSSSKSNVFKGLLDLTNQVKSGGAKPSLGNWIWVGGDWGSLVGGGVSL